MLYTLAFFPSVHMIVRIINPAGNHADFSAVVCLVPVNEIPLHPIPLIHYLVSYIVLVVQAHLPSRAMIPAPSKTETTMKANWRSLRVRSGLNRKSLASNSTKPV